MNRSAVLIALLVVWLHVPAGFGQDRLQEAGDAIVVRVNGTSAVLATVPKVRVFAVLKDGATNEIVFQGTFAKISIATFGLEATEEEKSTGKTALRENLSYVWGIQNTQHKWISFEDIDHITIEHGSETTGATDGYRSEIRLAWVNKGWRIAYNGKNSKFEDVEVELRNRPGI